MASSRLYGPSGQPAVPGGVVAANTQATNAAALPAKQVITTTSETVILNPGLNSATAALILNVPPGGPLEQRQFLLKVSGYITTTQITNVTLKIYNGTSTTVGSDGTALGSTGAIGVNNLSCPFWLEYKLIFDSVSGRLQGAYTGYVNNTVAPSLTTIAALTGISNVNNPVLNFLISVTFSAAATSNTINVQEFAIEF